MDLRGSKPNTDQLFNNISCNSEVFDVVVDPLTDFKVLKENSEPISPQQSYNLPSTLSRQHSSFEDANLCSSDVSLSSGSGSGSGCTKDKSGGSIGGGSSNNHRRLVIPEVHRFGYNPPCAGSPHDLASCPVASISNSQKRHQTERSNINNRNDIEKYDTLKALSQASSALALTETLIGPLRIPPVSREVLNEVITIMEKKSPLNFTQKGSVPDRLQKSNLPSPISDYNRPVVESRSIKSIPASNQPISSVTLISSNVGDAGYGSRVPLGSLPSVLEPNIHKVSKINGDITNQATMQSVAGFKADVNLGVDEKVGPSSVEGTSHSRVIAVPVGMSDHGPVEIYKEVHPYPASSITTVVERCSYIGQTQAGSQPLTSVKKRKKHSQKLKNKKANERYLSQSSLVSVSSACSSVASDHTITSKNSSELTPITQSHASSSKASLNDSRSDCGVVINKPILSNAIMQMRQALEAVSDNRSDKSKSSGGLEVASNFSDTSSNLSTLSDLSGYEDEYIRIKRLVSDAVIPPEDYKKMLDKTNAKSHITKPVPSVDYEKIIRDLHAQKEDLEIQLHRLSIQVQNAVREKELYQQQLDLMNTKITETNQKQYFEVLKQRANLEGQLEMLKQELENSVYEKNQLQAKIDGFEKEAKDAKNTAETAKESESLSNARLLKYEEANKDLEEKLRISNEELKKMSLQCNKVKADFDIVTEKNISMELSVEQLQIANSQMVAEIKVLKSHVSSLQEERQAQIQSQNQTEATVSKISSELKAAQNSSQWYQEQLQQSQTARANTQQELLETRANVAKLTSDKEALDLRVQTLVREAEDGQARSVREKASLVAHLEALQADMAERESLVSQMERDRGNDTKLMEDRRQRLEQDRHRIHKLRLDLSDTERQLDSIKDDLKHKCILISKYEKELKDLRTLEAVNQEVLGERDARILNQEQALSESKLLLNNTQQEIKQKSIIISSLKEEKSKLEVSFAAANIEKKEVDDAIIKVREDMTKLSSNFYRMKHDMAVKDRQIESYRQEAEDMKQLKDNFEKRYLSLESKLKDELEKKKYEQDIDELKKDNKVLVIAKESLNTQLVEIHRNLKTIEIEKKSLSEAVRLREEQIQNMQASLENYREAILKKDEELYVTHDQNTSLEKSYEELRRNWESLKEDNMALRQESDAYQEHEKAQRRELFDLKESIQKERKFKQSLEKKMEKILKSHEEDHTKLELERLGLEKKCSDLLNELSMLKEEKTKIMQFVEKLVKDHDDVCREIEVVKRDKSKAQSDLDDAVSELGESKQESTTIKNGLEMVKILENRMEDLLRENGSLTNKFTTLQNESHKKLFELEDSLNAKSQEIQVMTKERSGKDEIISQLEQEKSQILAQLKDMSAENDDLKNKLTSSETRNEDIQTSEHREVSNKKHGRNYDNLQKELSMLHIKFNETEAKLREVTKQKENMQATVKSTKKESVLMRAKMKEFESLKSRCKELEVSKISSHDLHAFETKCNEIESKLKLEEEKVISLECSLSAKGQSIHELEKREKDLCQQLTELQEDKRSLQLKVTTMEDLGQRSREDIEHYQSQLKLIENERDEWMVKYESLRDIIPERDTSTQRAVQLQMEDNHVISSSSEVIASSSLDSSRNLNHTDIGFLPDVSQTTIANGSQFDKTMADLQAQVNLTSKALQSKEQQICDLQYQLNALRLGETSNPNDNAHAMDMPLPLGKEIGTPFPQFSSSSRSLESDSFIPFNEGEVIPLQVHKQQIQSLLDKIKEIKDVKNSSDSQANDRMKENDENDGYQMLKEKVTDLEETILSKTNEVDTAQVRITEFQEKHRRYESNVRLLTRKLKEHMKGRKSAEKEIQIQAEENQRLMNDEHLRYAALRCRYIDLEGRSEYLEGQVAGLEEEVKEVRSALDCARREAQDHHQNTLVLQKEIGRLQELSKNTEKLRQEIIMGEGKISEKESRIKELEKDLQLSKSQLNANQISTEDLNTKLKQKCLEMDNLQQQLNNAETELCKLQEVMQNKEEHHTQINQKILELESIKSEVEGKLSKSEGQGNLLSSQLQKVKEQYAAITAEAQFSQVQLQENEAKINALENHIKVLKGELMVSKEEISVAKERQTNLDETHQIKLNQYEESINRSRQEVLTLSKQLGDVQKERVQYQTQATELRMALHSALAQLKTYEAEAEAREAIQTEVGIIPSPSPLDLTALTDLMQRSVRPIQSEAPLSSLQSCLSSLKAEVATLQNQLQTKGKEIGDESDSNGTSISEALMTQPTNNSSKSLSGTEIV